MSISKVVAFAALAVLSLAACKPTVDANRTNAASQGNSSSTATSNVESATTNAATPAAAATIDGTWKTDLSTMEITAKADKLLLKRGKFSCGTCVPPLTVAADGTFHDVTGRPYADEISVKADNDHNVTRLGRKAAKITSTVRYSVSADGKTLTVTYDDNRGSKPVHGSYTETRVSRAPARAHAISGSWKRDKINSISDDGLTVTFKADAAMLHMTNPIGQSFDAKLDGTETPVNGDIGGRTVSVTKKDDSFIETDKINGEVISVMTITVGADGKLHVVDENKRNGATTKYVMDKQ